MTVPLSLLDRSRTRRGEEPAQSLTRTIERARNADVAGYHRFWVAEHHGVPGVGSGAPALLVQAVAQATSRVRVGSGGVMLPNHRPLVVAEQFAMLAALHGPRIDLGVGRSLGFTKAVREALGTHTAETEQFEGAIRALRDHLAGQAEVQIQPAGVAPPPIFVLGTGSGLTIAARLGLPAVVGGPALWADAATFQAYRDGFQPSQQQSEPYLVASADVLIADTEAQARELALPEAWAMAWSRTEGVFPPLAPVSDIPDAPSRQQQRILGQHVDAGIHGTEDQVLTRLSDLLARTRADELMNTACTWDVDALHEADRRLSVAVGRM